MDISTGDEKNLSSLWLVKSEGPFMYQTILSEGNNANELMKKI